MAITNSGYPVSLADLQNEYGGVNPINLTEYYRNGSYVPTNAYTGNIPTGSSISMAAFYGSQKYETSAAVYSTAGTYSFVVPNGVTAINVTTIGGGGGGSGGGGDSGDAGVGGYAGGYAVVNNVVVTAGQSVSVCVGSGGAGGSGAYSGSGSMSAAAYGRAGNPSYLIVSGSNVAYSAGGAQQTLNASGRGGNANEGGQNSYYTTLYGVTTRGNGNNYGDGYPGIFGGSGGGGGSTHSGAGGYYAGGRGGDGYVKITYTQTLTTPGSFSVQVPQGVTSATISVYGGGGSGSTMSFCGDGYGGGGGGSGGYRTNQTLAVTPGETLAVVVGAGGAEVGYPGTCAGHRSGNAGGTSSVTGSQGAVSATGGAGGQANPNAYPLGGLGGAGGSPSGVSGTNGGNRYYGSGGSNGTGFGTGGIGGGGGAPSVNGSPGSAGRVVITWN